MLGRVCVVAAMAGMLLSAAVAAGLAILTRYAALALVPMGVLAILRDRRGDRAQRWRGALAFAIVSLMPVGAKFLGNQIRAGTTVNRELALHLISWRHISDALGSACDWITPIVPSQSVAVALTLGAVILLIVLACCIVALTRSNRRDERAGAAARIGAWFVLSYLLMLIVSVSLVDFHTQLNERLMFPALIGAIVVMASFGASLASNRLRLTATVVAALVLVISVRDGQRLARRMHHDGIGYSARIWQKSKLLATVKHLPPETVIYTNGADVLYLLEHRRTAPVPAKLVATSRTANRDLQQHLQMMRHQLGGRRAVVVMFKLFETHRPYYLNSAELKKELGLRAAISVSDGAVLELAR